MVLAMAASASAGQQLQPVATLKAIGGEVTCVGFTSQGRALFSGSLDTYVTVWTTDDLKRVTTIKPAKPSKAERGEHHAEFRSLAACEPDPTSDKVLVASGGDSIATYALPSGKQLGNRQLDASSMAASSDDSVVAVGIGSRVSVFATSDWRKLATLSVKGTVSTLRYAPTGQLLAVAVWRGGVQLWDTKTQTLVRTLSTEGNSEQMSFSPDGRWLGVAVWGSGQQTRVQVWEVSTGSEVTRLNGHNSDVWGVAFSPDGKFLVSGDTSGDVKLWKVASWQSCSQLKASGGQQIAISPDGHWLAAGGGTFEISLWDFRNLVQSCR
jgi:WD40 repeat protein